MTQDALLRLFKGIYIPFNAESFKPTLNFNKKTIPFGFVFAKNILSSYPDDIVDTFIPLIIKELCLSKEQLNESFHKSWNKIKNATIDQLLIEQLLHYFTTYGCESVGIQSQIYIPAEKLNIPKIKEDQISLIVIHGFTIDQITEKIMKLLESGIALKDQSLQDLFAIITDLSLKINLKLVKNKEMKCILCDHYNIQPTEPIELLRLMIYKCTQKSLIIKDRATIESIKSNPYQISKELFVGMEEKLASIFFRFKPLFLAFKANHNLIPVINKIRKLATINHKPMQEDYLNNITHNQINQLQLQIELSKVNVFRKIRLLYAIHNRMLNIDSVVYRIRNGKAYATTRDITKSSLYPTIYQSIECSIIDELIPKVKGKKIYFDPNFTYTLPTSEKQFSGNLPLGSYITLPKTMIFGVQWENLKRPECERPDWTFCQSPNRVDIDLSILGSEKYGWNTIGRSSDNSGDILFSGDMTDATNGAVEAFYIKKQMTTSYIVMLNRYNRKDFEIPFKFFVAEDDPSLFQKIQGHNYLIDPNKVKMMIPCILDADQKMLGLITTSNNETRLYFGESQIGRGNVSSNDKPYIKQTQEYLFETFTHPISLNEILVKSGAVKAKSPNDADIDLSIENLQKDSIIKLLV